MLGIFDSGLGGLTVLAAIAAPAAASRHNLSCRSSARAVRRSHRRTSCSDICATTSVICEALLRRAIVVACNTSCAVAMKHGWPASDVPVLNLIDNAAEAIAAMGVRRVGVLATTVTTQTGAYGNAIRARVPGVHVEEVAAPALVPLVEAGRYSGRAVRAAVAEACEPFSRDLDVLVLGCTHYPILDPHFAAIFGDGLVRLDPAIAQAEATVKLVAGARDIRGKRDDALCDDRRTDGVCVCRSRASGAGESAGRRCSRHSDAHR